MDKSPESEDLTGIRKWDLFKVVPPSNKVTPVEERTWYQFVVKLLKIFVYIITFLLVLGGAVTAKLSLLVMISRLNPDASISTICSAKPSSNAPLIPELERIYWTWLIYFAFAIPQFFVLIRSLRFCIFKGQRMPSLLQVAFPLLFETVHTIGLAFFVFTVLALLDSVKGAILCTTVCFVPAILSVFSSFHGSGWSIYRILNLIAVFLQGTPIFMWVLFPEKSAQNIWILPIALILISFGFWHNYVDDDSKFGFVRYLAKFKPKLLVNGYLIYVIISTWKIVLFLVFMILSLHIQGVQNVPNMFSQFTNAFGFLVDRNAFGEFQQNKLNIWKNPLFLQVIGALLCYVFGKYSCKICINRISFAVPLTLAVPATIAILVTLDPCFFNNPFYGNLEFILPTGNYFTQNHAWVWPFWFISQFWITIHIWSSNSERLSRTENLFSAPMYCGMLVDQSMALNRRREKLLSQTKNETFDGKTIVIDQSERDDIPRIYACATMWHETQDEMLEIMKSILRMDEDQGVRRIAAKHFQIVDNYYEYETHVLFDDAFQLSDPEDYNSPQILNEFVKTFIGVVDEAAAHVHQVPIHIRAPFKYPTPYGGRLEWILPGKTKMIMHLKDKSKIRHKKRWSQVMYMYYLLGHRLMDLPISEERKEIRARNTFILALDGDVDFQPIAVERLIDLMKKNPKLGAACGRIHPTGGAGLMLWYQKFEYAIGHWLQKATEHMIGCVLCSPGCFSLFRGKALMSDNVMAKYTTVSTEPRHYVQYDQGEDRWLCTLILQQGYRVDYSAASDAFTHAPEDFDEFYNQRRRWVPSTTANIMDMLSDFRRTVKVNPDISFWYIAYQFFLMFGTLVGPGTIFLMLVGALTAVLGVSQWLSFFVNLVPIVVFSFTCFYGNSKAQLTVAKILSVIYALLMVAVFVGIAVNVSEEGLLSPSSIFLVIVAASFVISALMHPLEIGCLLHGFIYFITIPSMYLLLIIFSIFNINNVSWGTREGPKVKSKQELLEEENEREEQKEKQSKSGIFGFLREGKDDTEGSFEFSFAGLFKLMCCTHEKKDSARIAASLEQMANRMEAVDRKLEALSNGNKTEQQIPFSPSINRKSSFRTAQNRASLTAMEVVEEDPEIKALKRIHFQEDDDIKSPEDFVRDDMINPYWITDKVLIRRKTDSLSSSEILFWNELIEKYLLPIDSNKKKEKEMAEALLLLRNKCVFTFFMINSIFVLLIFFLELKKKSLDVAWPLGEKDLTLEPIGFIFVVFFAIILFIQFIAMLFHRFGTLSHILASTPLNFFGFKTPCTSKTVEGLKKDAAVSKSGIGLVHALMQYKSLEGDPSVKGDRNSVEANSVASLHRRTVESMNPYESLDERFSTNWSRLSEMPARDQEKVLAQVVPIDKSHKRDTLNVIRSRLSMRQPSTPSLAKEYQRSENNTESGGTSVRNSRLSKQDSIPEAESAREPDTVRISGFDNQGFDREEVC